MKVVLGANTHTLSPECTIRGKQTHMLPLSTGSIIRGINTISPLALEMVRGARTLWQTVLGSDIRDVSYSIPHTALEVASGALTMQHLTLEAASGHGNYNTLTWMQSHGQIQYTDNELWKYHHRQTQTYRLSPGSNVRGINKTIPSPESGVQDMNARTHTVPIRCKV